ncbi:MAG TPA: hypothetical protein V6C85_14340 [Allocoleopsis sp.]
MQNSVAARAWHCHAPTQEFQIKASNRESQSAIANWIGRQISVRG